MFLDGTTSFEKGIDFALYFGGGRRFTVRDIQSRYGISYRQAHRLKGQVDRIIGLRPVGFGKTDLPGPEPFLWEFECAETKK